MLNTGFFLAVAGLGVSFAGFAGLIATFAEEGHRDSPVWWWRITAVVRTGLELTFLGLGVVAFEVVTGDAELTVRIATGLIVAGGLNEVIRHSRPGPAWPDEAIRRVTVAISLLGLAVAAVNLVLGSVGFLMVLVLFTFSTPASVFVRAIADMGRIRLTTGHGGPDSTKAS